MMSVNKGALKILETYKGRNTESQLYQIYLGAFNGIDPYLYAEGYNANQMAVLRSGLERGKDVVMAFNPQYSAARMSQIIRAVAGGVDTKYVTDLRYNSQQAAVLLQAQLAGIDCSSFDDPSMSATRMRTQLTIAKAKADGEEPFVIKEAENGLLVKNIETGEMITKEVTSGGIKATLEQSCERASQSDVASGTKSLSVF